jgi:hypothetical protein
VTEVHCVKNGLRISLRNFSGLGSNSHSKVIVEIKYITIFCFSGLVSAMRSNGPHCKSISSEGAILWPIGIFQMSLMTGPLLPRLRNPA